MIRFERRASTVLFNLLRAHTRPGPILIPENACAVVVLLLEKLGRTVEPVEISLRSTAIDHERLLVRWADRCRAAPAGLIYVRPYGRLDDISRLFAQLRDVSPDALIVDDRCLGFPDPGVTLDDGVDAILYSTGYAKCVDLGCGGFAVTHERTGYCTEPGPYSEDADWHWAEASKAAVAAERPLNYQDCDWLDRRLPVPWEEHLGRMREEEANSRSEKRRINAIYAQGLPRAVLFPAGLNDWRFNLWVRNSDAVLRALFSEGLFASSHFSAAACPSHVRRCARTSSICSTTNTSTSKWRIARLTC